MSSEPGSLGEEARRLVEAFSDWSRDHAPGLAAGAGSSPECRYCPLCQLIAVLRGERPDLTARLAETGAAFVAALRSVLSVDDGRPDADPAEEQPPRVEHIDLG